MPRTGPTETDLRRELEDFREHHPKPADDDLFVLGWRIVQRPASRGGRAHRCRGGS